jgi:hypothetical protein
MTPRMLLKSQPPLDDNLRKPEFQSDTSQFGRGVMHLSALLDEGDVVAYQTGRWLVNQVAVGDGTAEIQFCRIDTIQVVWTHNCEHGVLRGEEMIYNTSDGVWLLRSTGRMVEFGPEQVTARIPVIDWSTMDGQSSCVPFILLNETNPWLVLK